MEHSEPLNLRDTLPDEDYSCAAAFCDDPACNMHGPKDSDGELLYWIYRVSRREKYEGS